MFRCLTRSAPVVVAVVIATLMAGVPARATVTNPVLTNKWRAPECAVGELTGAGRDINGAVQLFGAASVCGKYVDGSMFGIAVYHLAKPDAKPFARIPNARYFYEHEKRDFGIAAFGGARKEAVCLVADSEYRLSCAIVTAYEGSPVTMTPIPTNDPLVSRPVKFGMEDPAEPGDPTTSCATCF
jgi:hypothetical protein